MPTVANDGVSGSPLELNIAAQNAISFRPFGITIALWTIFVGGIGNVLTILTYVANTKLRTTFNVFLLNLAIIDLWTAVGMMPFNLAGYVQMDWPFGKESFTTRLQAFNYFSCGYSSVIFLVAITVNRLIGAMYPGKYSVMFNRERMIVILVFCHLFAPVFLLPFLAGTDPKCPSPMHSLTGFNTDQFLCTFVCLPEGGWNSYMQFTRVLFQFLPLIVMIVLYAVIFSVVHRKRTAISVRMGRQNKLPSTENGNTIVKKKTPMARQKSTQEQRRSREDSRMLVISVVICIAFMVTFLPSVIVNLLPNSKDIDIRWHMAASNLSWFNASLNPVIYVLLNRRYRREYWRIVQMAVGLVREKFVHDTISTTGANITGQNSVAVNGSETETIKLKTVR